jgi:hypothetical protein
VLFRGFYTGVANFALRELGQCANSLLIRFRKSAILKCAEVRKVFENSSQ